MSPSDRRPRPDREPERLDRGGAVTESRRLGPARAAPGRHAMAVLLLLGFLLASAPAAFAAPPSGTATEPPEVIHLDTTTAAPDASAADAPPGAEVVPATSQGMNAREILSGLWFKYQALRQRGADQEAATLMAAAIGFMQREGLQAAPEIAAALLVDGRRSLRDGDDAKAITAFGLASRL